MTVLNAEKFVSEAIQSILDQSYTDFEFIIIDDGSTDNTPNIIKSFKDRRIVCKSQKNAGVPKASNKAISMAKGEYIARQDADDYSSLKRLERQVSFLDDNPDIGLVGSNYSAVNLAGDTVFETNFFTKSDDLKLATVFSNQFGHGSTMIRKSALNEVGGYREISIVHDYDLWVRISRIAGIANLNDELYTWRFHGASLSNSKFDNTLQQSQDVREDAFSYFLSHKNEFPVFSFHPFSTKGVFGYLAHKSKIYRNMSLMYAQHGLRRSAVPALLIATAFAPWLSRNYTFLITLMFSKQKISGLPYE